MTRRLPVLVPKGGETVKEQRNGGMNEDRGLKDNAEIIKGGWQNTLREKDVFFDDISVLTSRIIFDVLCEAQGSVVTCCIYIHLSNLTLNFQVPLNTN